MNGPYVDSSISQQIANCQMHAKHKQITFQWAGSKEGFKLKEPQYLNSVRFISPN